MSPETRFEARYFVIKANAEGEISQIDTGHIAAITADQARSFAERVLESGRTGGYLGVYKYKVTETAYGSLLVFVDCRTQLQTAGTFLLASCGIAAACLLLVFLLVSVLSKRAIRRWWRAWKSRSSSSPTRGMRLKPRWRLSPPTPTCWS